MRPDYKRFLKSPYVQAENFLLSSLVTDTRVALSSSSFPFTFFSFAFRFLSALFPVRRFRLCSLLLRTLLSLVLYF